MILFVVAGYLALGIVTARHAAEANRKLGFDRRDVQMMAAIDVLLWPMLLVFRAIGWCVEKTL